MNFGVISLKGNFSAFCSNLTLKYDRTLGNRRLVLPTDHQGGYMTGNFTLFRWAT